VPLSHGHFPQFGGYSTEFNLLRAHKETRITQTTKPDQIRGEYIFSPAEQNHMNYLARIKVFNNLVDWANPCAGAAGKTGLDSFQTYLFGDFVLEMRI